MKGLEVNFQIWQFGQFSELNFSGTLEYTLLKSHMRGANLRRWLRRPGCPEVIRQFKRLFDKAFYNNQRMENETTRSSNAAHYVTNDVVFSRSSSHVGNSIVFYYPSPSSSTPIAGSIQSIDSSRDQVFFSIKRQAPLPPGKHDPFCRFPLFPAVTYSSQMDDSPEDLVPAESVVSHAARYSFSSDRAVLVNLSRVIIPCYAEGFIPKWLKSFSRSSI
jgi:hypothetical protein